MQQAHRPGLYKQSNKQHKTGRHRSKGEINASTKGKVGIKIHSLKKAVALKKKDRRQQSILLRIKKREEALFKKREIGGIYNAPLLIGIVPLFLDDKPVSQRIIDVLCEADPDAVVNHSEMGYLHITVPRWKQRFEFITPHEGNLDATLDVGKVADGLIFLVSAKNELKLSTELEILLTSLVTQGLPTTNVVALDMDVLHIQKRSKFKQEVDKVLSRWLPDEKVLAIEKNGDGLTLLRRLGAQKQRTVLQRDMRAHILAEHIEASNETDSGTCTVNVTGYLRGQGLNVNDLVHIPGWGDFRLAQIDSVPDPRASEMSSNTDCNSLQVLQTADPNFCGGIVTENIPDPMDAEQTWPTEEEMKDTVTHAKLKRKIPKGMSSYQACWIPEPDDGDGDSGSDEDPREDDEECMAVDESDDDEDKAVDDWESSSNVSDTDQYDAKMDAQEEEDALRQIQVARDEATFPDEVDTPRDLPARQRFCKYRGLASFRTSPWDPKENLPLDYARIFQFENFERSKRRVLREQEDRFDVVAVGRYIRVAVKDVPVDLVRGRSENEPLIVCALLPHEHQMSVINVYIKRSIREGFSQVPIKSKETVLVHCGFRRYRVKPLYSQHTNGNKHKYERYLQAGATAVATFFAPITFPPASVLMFRENGRELIATGRVLSVNPDRLIIKRVVLSGHPFRILKHSAIIRFMFFNREDIDWFKSVELRTKYGRRGHIKEALGTHGHMKAVFDDQLKSQDTVLMQLFKRVYPPWYYNPELNYNKMC